MVVFTTAVKLDINKQGWMDLGVLERVHEKFKCKSIVRLIVVWCTN